MVYDVDAVNYLASKYPVDFETAYILVQHIMAEQNRLCYSATDELMRRKPFLFLKISEEDTP